MFDLPVHLYVLLNEDGDGPVGPDGAIMEHCWCPDGARCAVLPPRDPRLVHSVRREAEGGHVEHGDVVSTERTEEGHGEGHSNRVAFADGCVCEVTWYRRHDGHAAVHTKWTANRPIVTDGLEGGTAPEAS